MLEGEELERRAEEERSYYTGLLPYCRYPDCFHCPYKDCGWTGSQRNEDEIQELIRGYARKTYK